MIVITGAAGFIGSCLLGRINALGREDVVIVDDFSRSDKFHNFSIKHFSDQIERSMFMDWLRQHHHEVEIIFHLGARTDTTEFDAGIFDELNTGYSKKLFTLCAEYGILFIYASSAAVYGAGEHGYSDGPELLPVLRPLNPYGQSKLDFDRWVGAAAQTPPWWAGFRFFNVYGPNEYHKGRMASVVMHAFNQISQTGRVRLFRSHRPDYEDGMQLRDFIYVFDVVDVLIRFWNEKPASGIYNLGTGHASAFLHLAEAVFAALDLNPAIEFVDTPADIRDKYQYFTQADTTRLLQAVNLPAFTSLADGVADYVKRFLLEGRRY